MGRPNLSIAGNAEWVRVLDGPIRRYGLEYLVPPSEVTRLSPALFWLELQSGAAIALATVEAYEPPDIDDYVLGIGTFDELWPTGCVVKPRQPIEWHDWPFITWRADVVQSPCVHGRNPDDEAVHYLDSSILFSSSAGRLLVDAATFLSVFVTFDESRIDAVIAHSRSLPAANYAP